MRKQSDKHYRYEFVHGEDFDFVAYQRDAGHGAWQAVSTWMVPGADR